ncbi:Uncharacterised protein [Bordetella ansorpii]|uniref:Uncharacterized protein n=1 Tax=Bordetella ansorpii TaxID=288768 RepID=A0A157STT6_9BORD|nr:hypothetical protein [Bordetella ansorpii]SAI73849.1 Uncharacterised protein [Bordetella ansorpii]
MRLFKTRPAAVTRRVPREDEFPPGSTFHIKEFDVPLVHVPGQGWFNWFGGAPRAYDINGLKLGNNWPAQDFQEWATLVRDSLP